MKRNPSPETISAAIVIAAVLTTAPRHVISALQLEGVVIAGVIWSAALAVLSIAFAALEGVALLQIEKAQGVADAPERKRLSVIKALVYITIPATFVAPLVAQSQHIKLAELLAPAPAALWILAALNVAAPMFVISAAAASGSVLSAHARQTKAPKMPAIDEPALRVSKPARKSLPEPLELTSELAQSVAGDSAQVEPTGEPIAQATAGAINRAELAELLRDNPVLTSGALAERYRVSPAAIRLTPEWKARKEVRS